MTRPHKGYTLAEILIVVTIIVVLGIALLLALNPMAQIFKGYDARRRADLAKIKIALEGYYSDHDCYPLFPLKDANDRPSYACDSDILKPYLPNMPCDPNSHKPYTIYLSPPDATCPQNFAVYAQIYSFFDKYANSIEDCSNTVTVTSSGINFSEINFGCSGNILCSEHYGCISGTCQKVSGYEQPACHTNYPCSRNCGGVDCSVPSNACVVN